MNSSSPGQRKILYISTYKKQTMARTGVLSDVAIKHHCPEFFPPDLGVQKGMSPIHFQDHVFEGIKTPKMKKTHTTFARFPATDLHNFAMFASPQRYQEAYLEAVHNFRKELGSDNHPTDLNKGYELQKLSTHKPYPMKAPSTAAGTSTYLSGASTDIADLSSLSHFHTAPSSLTLGRMTRKEGREAFDKEIALGRNIFAPESRAFMSNLGIDTSLDVLFPGGNIPAKAGKMSHSEVLSVFESAYRGSSEDLARIRRADAAARAHGVIPDQSQFMSSIMGHRSSMENMEDVDD